MGLKRPPWVTRQDTNASCTRCGGKSEYRFMPFWHSSPLSNRRQFTYWFWWQKFKKAHKRCPQRRPNYESLDNGKLDISIVKDWDALLKQMNSCRNEKHSRYTHDSFGLDMSFRSLVCKTCNKRFVFEEHKLERKL